VLDLIHFPFKLEAHLDKWKY